MRWPVCASKPCISHPVGCTRTHAHPGHMVQMPSLQQRLIETPYFDKPLKAVTSVAVTNWKRQKEELIRSDFLSYKSGVMTRHTQVWAAHVFSEHQLCSLNGWCWELMTSRHIKLCRVLYQNWKRLQIGGWITGSCIRNPSPPPSLSLILLIFSSICSQCYVEWGFWPKQCRASLFHCTYCILIAFVHIFPLWAHTLRNTAGVRCWCCTSVCILLCITGTKGLLVYVSVRDLYFLLSWFNSDHRIISICRLKQLWFAVPAEIGRWLTHEQSAIYEDV